MARSRNAHSSSSAGKSKPLCGLGRIEMIKAAPRQVYAVFQSFAYYNDREKYDPLASI
jgi:hypothetical protein